jgi:arylsulfatase A-like enzyme
MYVFEENVRVPLLFAAPGLIQRPVRVPRLASLIDVMPTVLELLGLAGVEASQGRSLLLPRDQMVLFYTDYAQAWVGLRDGRWKFLHELGSGRSRLFELSTDPAEAVDLSTQWPERVAAYRSHACRWSQAQKANILSWRDSDSQPSG